MKKMISILCIAALCLLCLAGSAAAELIEFSESPVADMVSIGDTAYIRTQRAGIHTLKPGDTTLTLYAEGYDSPRYTGLFAADGVLYTLDRETYCFAGIGENGRGAPLDGLEIPDFKKVTRIKEDWSIYCMRNTPSGLFRLMYLGATSEKMTLCRFDLSSRRLSCRTIPRLYDYCVGDDGVIRVVQQIDGVFVLSILDWRSGRLEKTADLPWGATGMVQQGDDLILNVKRGQIIRCRPDGTIEPVMQMPIRQNNHINCLLLDGNVLLCAEVNLLAYQELPEARP